MASITGIASTSARLRAAGRARIAMMTEGLKKAGAYLLAEANRIVPVDYGNLKASGAVRVTGEGTSHVVVEVYYTAAYAIFVHEVPGGATWGVSHGQDFNVKHAKELAMHPTTGPFRHYRGPDQVYKWLEKTYRDKRNDMIAIIMQELS